MTEGPFTRSLVAVAGVTDAETTPSAASRRVAAAAVDATPTAVTPRESERRDLIGRDGSASLVAGTRGRSDTA